MKAFWILTLLVFSLLCGTTEAQTYTKMGAKKTQAFVETATVTYNYSCFYICDGVKIPVRKGNDGVYRTADGTKISATKVTCIGKAVDKVATANATANRAERKADKALAGNARAQATADSALVVACRNNDQLDSLEQVVQQLLDENGQQATELKILTREMPEDQNVAVQELQCKVSDLEDKDQMFEAFARSTHKHTWEKIVDRAQEVDAQRRRSRR